MKQGRIIRALLTLLGLTLSVQQAAWADSQVQSGRKYRIQNVASGLMLSNNDGGSHMIIETPDEESAYQQWTFRLQEDSTLTLYNVGKMAYAMLSTSNSWDAAFTTDLSSLADISRACFSLDDLESGNVGIRLKYNGKYLGTDSRSTGSWVYMDKKTSANGEWLIEPVSTSLADEFQEWFDLVESIVLGDYATFPQAQAELLGRLEKYKSDYTDYETGIDELTTLYGQLVEAFERVQVIETYLAEVDQLLADTSYPGHDHLAGLAQEWHAMLANGTYDFTFMLEGGQTILAAIDEYYLSQLPVATPENPADLTFMYIRNPSFRLERNYSDDATLTTDGWTMYMEPATNGEQGARRKGTGETGRDVTCYNAWSTSFTLMELSQQLTGLPEGRYKVSAMLWTTEGHVADQHTFCQSSQGISARSAAPTEALSSPTWEVLTTEDEVAVYDGELRIGVRSTNETGKGATGWFLATDFRLLYTGAVDNNVLAETLKKKIAEAEALSTPFRGDQAQLLEAIEQARLAEGEEAIKEAIDVLNEAIEMARKSAAAYDSFVNGTIREAMEDESYQDIAQARSLMENVRDYVMELVGDEGASYESMEFYADVFGEYYAYVSLYATQALPVLNSPEDYREGAADALRTMTERHWQTLQGDIDVALAAECHAQLKEAMKALLLLRLPSEQTDLSSFISNATVAGGNKWWTWGWNVSRGNGNQDSSYGSHYSGDEANWYLDSWASSGLNYTARQTITGLPNGKYRFRAAVRCDGDGCYLYAINTYDVLYKEMAPNSSGENGSIYDDAMRQAIEDRARETGRTPEEVEMEDDIEIGYVAKGWDWVDVTDIVVYDGTLTIGISTDATVTQGVAFTGTYLSADDFQLFWVEDGDNDDFEWPIVDAIEAVSMAKPFGTQGAAYDLTGRRTVPTRGLYIIATPQGHRKVVIR